MNSNGVSGFSSSENGREVNNLSSSVESSSVESSIVSSASDKDAGVSGDNAANNNSNNNDTNDTNDTNVTNDIDAGGSRGVSSASAGSHHSRQVLYEHDEFGDKVEVDSSEYEGDNFGASFDSPSGVSGVSSNVSSNVSGNVSSNVSSNVSGVSGEDVFSADTDNFKKVSQEDVFVSRKNFVSAPATQQIADKFRNGDKPFSSKGRVSNWPHFLVPAENQIFYSIVCLIVMLVFGISGIGFVGAVGSAYYIFVLDDSVEKDSLSKTINIACLALAAIFLFVLLVFSLFFVSLL